jgi:2-oxoglutarate dehydrogenase E1 component
MSRTDLNDVFGRTSFLYGGNVRFIEQLYARYLNDPKSVDPEWQSFFASLGDGREAALEDVEAPSWARTDWPALANGDLDTATAAGQAELEKHVAPRIDKRGGLSAEQLRKATLDSVRALMMIRAYRMRGHLAADLDPLRLRKVDVQPELDPASYGFGPEDYDRPIFIDNVLGLERATIREMLDILKRTYCSTLGVEFMHISDPQQKAWIQSRIE